MFREIITFNLVDMCMNSFKKLFQMLKSKRKIKEIKTIDETKLLITFEENYERSKRKIKS
jgi:hypothetical protein